MENKDQRERNLYSLSRPIRFYQLLFIIVLAVLPYIKAGTENLRIYGIFGAVFGEILVYWYQFVVQWCDRTGRDWGSSLWFTCAVLVASVPISTLLYALTRIVEHAPDWNVVLSFSWAAAKTEIGNGVLFCSLIALVFIVVTSYRRGEHILFKGREPNKFWQIRSIIMGVSLILIIFFLWTTFLS